MSEENNYMPPLDERPQSGPDPQQNPYEAQQPQPPQNPYQPQQPQAPYPPQQPQYGQPQNPYQPQEPYAPQQQPYGQPQAPYPPQQPAYGQPQDAYGQQPYPSGQQPVYGQMDPNAVPGYPGGPEEPPKKKSVLPKVLIGVAAAAVVGTGAFFLFGNGGGGGGIGSVGRNNPEEYLTQARQRTSENITDEGETAEAKPPEQSLFPDFSRFEGPNQVDISLEVLSLYDEPELEGAYIDVTAKTDSENKRALFELGVGYAGLSLRENRLYVEEDFIALSIPDLYSRHKYISVQPSTLVDDWNNSELGDMYPIDFDLDLGGMFDTDDTEFTQAAEKFGTDWNAHFESLYTTAAFTDEGTNDVTIRGQTVKAAVLCYSLDATQANEFYTKMLAITEEFTGAYYDYLITAGESLESIYYYNPYEYMIDDMAEFFREAEKLRFPEGLKITFYVNEDDGLINRLSLDGTKIGHADYPGEEYDLGFVLDMIGEERLTDNFEVSIYLKDEYEDFRFIISNEATRGDTITDKLSISAEADGEKEFEMTLETSWNTKQNTDNFSMRLDALDDWGDKIFLSLTGSLVETADAIAFTGGVLEGGENDVTEFSFGIGFGIKSIPASEVEIDKSEAVSFFELSIDQLAQDIMAGAMSLAAAF